MLKRIEKLVDLKSIITLLLTIAMIIFTWKELIPTELFVTVTSAVFTYYFTRKKEE